jgi:alpha-amylase
MMNCSTRKRAVAFLAACLTLNLVELGPPAARAGVLLQAYYQQRGGVGAPTPADGAHPAGDAPADFWWDHLAKQARSLREAGVTAVWLPPVWKGASGTFSVGFDLFDDYDMGSKDQKGTRPTRYGTREQLTRCVAILRANGIDVYIDVVENQRMGGDGAGGFTFRYADAFGKPGGGRFPKNPDCFHHQGISQDPNVPGPDFSFGPDLAPINGKPPHYVSGGLKASADWMTRALDVQGYRFDDPKGISTDFVRDLFNSGSLRGKFVVGEYYDGNLGSVENWIQNGTGGRCNAFDFPLRFNFLTPMCNNAGFFDMSQLDHAGLAGADPLHAVTFVENHDLDLTDPIVRNKAQAYAYILTSEGYPCVFYKDYSTDPGCYGMKPIIDNLIFIHEKIASGTTQQRFKNHDIFAFERQGGSNLLVGLNNNGINTATITVDTGFGSNVKLHDYTGHSGDVQTNGQGQATIAIPKNTEGLGYVCYSRGGIGGTFNPPSHSVTQEFEGAKDLDIPPADNTQFVTVGRVWVAKDSPIKGALKFDATGWTGDTSITLELINPAGVKLATKNYARSTPQGEPFVATAAATGFHTFQIRSTNTPVANPMPSYTLSVTYQAPQELK